MMTHRLITAEDVPLMWSWMMQYPDNNTDDEGAQDGESFRELVRAKEEAGICFRIVVVDGRPCGFVGWMSTGRVAMFQGICFDESVHGLGIAAEAVQMLLTDLFAAGLRKVSAAYFSHNQRVDRFFAKLGAKYEGTLKSHAMQHGRPVDMTLVAFCRGE